jgi:exoribonuclease R
MGELDGLFYPDPAGHKGYFLLLGRRQREDFCLTIDFQIKLLRVVTDERKIFCWN